MSGILLVKAPLHLPSKTTSQLNLFSFGEGSKFQLSSNQFFLFLVCSSNRNNLRRGRVNPLASNDVINVKLSTISYDV